MSKDRGQGRSYKSHTFSCSAKWMRRRIWEITSDDLPVLVGGAPTAFGGDGKNWSPEELLLASVNACYLSTFVSYCKRKDFGFVSYESLIEGLLEHDGTTFKFTRIMIRPKVVVKLPEDVDTAREYLERAHELCFMGRSVNAEITVEPEIIVK